MKSTADKILRDKLMKEIDLDVPEAVERLQQDTHPRKVKKEFRIPRALVSTREKNIKRLHTQNNISWKKRIKCKKRPTEGNADIETHQIEFQFSNVQSMS